MKVFWVRKLWSSSGRYKFSRILIFTQKAYFIIINKCCQLFSWNDRLTSFEKMSTKHPNLNNQSLSVVQVIRCSMKKEVVQHPVQSYRCFPRRKPSCFRIQMVLLAGSFLQWPVKNLTAYSWMPLHWSVLRWQQVCSQCFCPINTNINTAKGQITS